MAKGKTHDKITLILAPIVVGIIISINNSISKDLGDTITYSLLGLFFYIFGGFMFSGDLDIRSLEYNRWGYLKLIWIPYQKLFSHRSIFTHGFILGPLLRLFYIYILVLLICAPIYSFGLINLSTTDIINETKIFISNNKFLCFNILFALFLGSGLHTATDIIYSFFKKYFVFTKRKGKRKRKKLLCFHR